MKQNTRFIGSSDQLRYFRNQQEADEWAKKHKATVVTGKEQLHKSNELVYKFMPQISSLID